MITGGFVPSRTVKPSCSSPFTVHSSIACETIRTSGELLQALPRSYAREANGVAIHGPHLHSPTVSWSIGAHANRVASVTPLQTFLPFLFSFRHTFDKGLAPLDSDIPFEHHGRPHLPLPASPLRRSFSHRHQPLYQIWGSFLLLQVLQLGSPEARRDFLSTI